MSFRYSVQMGGPMPRGERSQQVRLAGTSDTPAPGAAQGGLACPVCSETRYYLELRADGRSDRGGLSISCSRCRTSRSVFNESRSPR